LLNRVLLAALAAAVILGLTACGGSSSAKAGASASTTPAVPGRGGFFGAARDPKVAACLKKQGVTLPTGRAPRPNGTPPAGRPRNRAPRGGAFLQRFQKLRTALQKCGVKLPTRPFNGPPGGAPPSSGAGST
jgi:hypothetical protein